MLRHVTEPAMKTTWSASREAKITLSACGDAYYAAAIIIDFFFDAVVEGWFSHGCRFHVILMLRRLFFATLSLPLIFFNMASPLLLRRDAARFRHALMRLRYFYATLR